MIALAAQPANDITRNCRRELLRESKLNRNGDARLFAGVTLEPVAKAPSQWPHSWTRNTQTPVLRPATTPARSPSGPCPAEAAAPSHQSRPALVRIRMSRASSFPNMPLSPAIRLGASQILSVGVRSSRAADTLAREEAGAAASPGEGPPQLACPPLAQITGVFLNAIFLDHLDADLDHLTRMNEIVASGQRESSARASEPIRSVTPLSISPSEDLALVAQRFVHRMPRLLRFLLDGLGTPDAQSADLMSYLLFDAAYTRTLVELGRRDAEARLAEIEAFVRAAPPLPAAQTNSPRARAAHAALRRPIHVAPVH